jgi:cytochrome c-type biogenesis protein CcmE
MKTIQKFILPLLLILVIALIYFVYFSPAEGLGSFSDFDPNNNAVKDIRVNLVHERGINKNPGGGAVFFTVDKNNTVVQVNADKIPPGLESAGIIILKGHLSAGNSFHAHDVVID